MLILPFLYFFVNAAETQRMCKQKAVSNLVQRPKKKKRKASIKTAPMGFPGIHRDSCRDP